MKQKKIRIIWRPSIVRVVWPKVKEHGIRYLWDADLRYRLRREKDRKKYGKNWTTVRRKKVRKRLFYRDGNKCFWCGECMKERDATIDHIVPVSVQPRNNRLDNLRLIHDKCRTERDWAVEEGIIRKDY